MNYSNIRSRAGLVALVFALIISLVSAVPIPATESSTLSLRDNGLDSAKISTPHAATGALTHRHVLTDTDSDDSDQLVRRSKIGDKIKHAFQKVGHAFQKVGSDIKKGIVTAAKKVGNFVKTTGAKVAKFGLKVVQSVGEVVGHVASFIPGIGKPIQQAIHGVSAVAGVVSDHIHAKLSAKLQKGMNVMNKADKVMSYIPRRRELSEEEAFQQRDISEANYYLEERDDYDIALENREESYFEAYERDIYERHDLD